ncbi:MAG: DUF4340 domain-containing protein [Pirellula sp.]|nr:DUF4340 domain-containing protein [Pirellula sp.]
MSEGQKTGIFAVIAGVVALLAWATTSRNVVVNAKTSRINQVIFEKFNDPLTAASLKLLRYDSSKEQMDEFEVSKDRKTGVWSIPSHESYPADASKQMADAATLFVGLKALDVASEKREDQSLFGVIAPDKQKEDQGGDGVGMLVQMRDEKGEMLADIIIGKDVDGNKKKRFVRIPSEDVIYVAELDTTPLTTEFKQWIEPDLLQLSSTDIETFGIRDYQILPTNQGQVLSRNYEADINYVTASGQWEAVRVNTYDSDPPGVKTVGENEQLNTTKLNDIKSALDNLKIADVTKKPAGLAADLKGDRSKLSREVQESLARRGFFPNPNQKEGDVVDFFSKNGELIVTLKDGVQYLLRFGGSASADINAAVEEGKEESVSINRFLLVTARLDESKIPPAILEKVPESVEELKALEALKNAASNPTPALNPSADTPTSKPEDAPKLESDKPAEPKVEETKPESGKTAEEPKANSDEPVKEDPSKSDQASKAKTSAKLISTTQEAEAKAAASQESAPASQPAPATPAVPQEPTEEEWKERLEATKEKITKENSRKVEEREEKLKKAKTRVAELNRRFADWYYVVSEADFKRMRIPLNELIQPKAASGASGLPGAPGGFGGGAGPFGGASPFGGPNQ